MSSLLMLLAPGAVFLDRMSSGVMGCERRFSGEGLLSVIACDGRINCCKQCSDCVTSVPMSGSNVAFPAGEFLKFCCQNFLWTAFIPSAMEFYFYLKCLYSSHTLIYIDTYMLCQSFVY